MNMSYPSRQKYLDVLRQRYAKASTHQEKSQIIDEAVHTLGHHRKHVIRELNRSHQKRSKPRHRQKSLIAIIQGGDSDNTACLGGTG